MTKNNEEANKLFDRTKERLKEGGWFSVVVKDPKNVRRLFRLLIQNEKWSRRVVTSIRKEDGVLFVKVKPPSREEILESLLHEALLHIEDENVYDRILAALEEKYYVKG
jgi:hypothetical protein